MALKDTYFIYTAKNSLTGLTDVTAKVRRNGTYVLGSDVTPINLTEVDGGRYQLLLTAAQLTTAGGAGWYDVYIDSASKSAPATAGKLITANDSDDLQSQIDGVETKVDTIDTNVDSIKVTVEDTNTVINSATVGNANIKALIDALQSSVTNISNVTRFSAPLPMPLVSLDSGTKVYKIPINLYDTNGNMEDPDSDQIQVQIADEAGNVRDSYLDSFTAQPYYATKNAAGDYEFDLNIPDTAGEEQLIFTFTYAEGATTLVQKGVTEVRPESATAGLALETTSQSILTDTADMQPRVLDIQSVVNNVTFGLSALKTLLDTIDTNTDGLATEIGNATYGLSALRTAIDTKASQTSVNSIQTDVTEIQGAGFVEADDSLEAISSRVYTGGSAV